MDRVRGRWGREWVGEVQLHQEWLDAANCGGCVMHVCWVVTGVSAVSEILHEKVKVVLLCLTLCDPIDYTVHGILQARILEWVAFPFSRGCSQLRDRTQVSHIAEFFTS